MDLGALDLVLLMALVGMLLMVAFPPGWRL